MTNEKFDRIAPQIQIDKFLVKYVGLDWAAQTYNLIHAGVIKGASDLGWDCRPTGSGWVLRREIGNHIEVHNFAFLGNMLDFLLTTEH